MSVKSVSRETFLTCLALRGVRAASVATVVPTASRSPPCRA